MEAIAAKILAFWWNHRSTALSAFETNKDIFRNNWPITQCYCEWIKHDLYRIYNNLQQTEINWNMGQQFVTLVDLKNDSTFARYLASNEVYEFRLALETVN